MIGEVQGVSEGDSFSNRQELHDAGVHAGTQGGIGGGGESIVLSGGYVDDLDEGDVILYTGQGGRDQNSSHQIAAQELTRGNLKLAQHYNEGNPIRVSRGSQLDSPYAPKGGYRYDGLYRIDDFWHEEGKDGFLVYRFRFVKLGRSTSEILDTPTKSDELKFKSPEGTTHPGRAQIYTSRVIRNSAVANHVKEVYRYKCQVSGVILNTPTGPYAEGCHIKAVGSPHNGPDTVNNVLCLSPNMHVLFDKGAIAIADDFKLLGIEGELTVDPHHEISIEYLRYHREHFYTGE